MWPSRASIRPSTPSFRSPLETQQEKLAKISHQLHQRQLLDAQIAEKEFQRQKAALAKAEADRAEAEEDLLYRQASQVQSQKRLGTYNPMVPAGAGAAPPHLLRPVTAMPINKLMPRRRASLQQPQYHHRPETPQVMEINHPDPTASVQNLQEQLEAERAVHAQEFALLQERIRALELSSSTPAAPQSEVPLPPAAPIQELASQSQFVPIQAALPFDTMMQPSPVEKLKIADLSDESSNQELHFDASAAGPVLSERAMKPIKARGYYDINDSPKAVHHSLNNPLLSNDDDAAAAYSDEEFDEEDDIGLISVQDFTLPEEPVLPSNSGKLVFQVHQINETEKQAMEAAAATSTKQQELISHIDDDDSSNNNDAERQPHQRRYLNTLTN